MKWFKSQLYRNIFKNLISVKRKKLLILAVRKNKYVFNFKFENALNKNKLTFL